MRHRFPLLAIVGFVLSATALGAGSEASAQSPAPGKADAAKVDLNTASLETLRTIKGVTAKIAKDIIANRCYRKTSDLLDKRVLPAAVFNDIEDQVIAGKTCVPAAPTPAGSPDDAAAKDKGAGKAQGKGDEQGGS